MQNQTSVRPGSSRHGHRHPMLDEDREEFFGSAFGEEEVWGLDRLVADGIVENPEGVDPLEVLTAPPPPEPTVLLTRRQSRRARRRRGSNLPATVSWNCPATAGRPT